MKTLSKEAEQRILDAISDVCDLVNEGSTPTEAVIKVAKDRDFNRNFVKLAIAGYNTGATTYQRQTGKGILEKLAEFPLAREEDVMEALFPSSVLAPVAEKNASAVSTVYSMAPKRMAKVAAAFEKAASVKLAYPEPKPEPLPGDSKIAMQKAYGQAEKQGQNLQIARAKYAEAQERFVSLLGQLGDYFKQSSYDRDWAFTDVDAIAAQTYGVAGSHIMDYVAKRNRIKEARTTQVKTAQAVDWDAKPFNLLTSCVKAAEAVVALRTIFNAKQAETEARVNEILHPFCHTQPQSSNGSTSVTTTKEASSDTKEASLWGGFTYNLTRPIAETLVKTPDQRQSSAEKAFTDPYIDQELQAIRARAMLQDLLTNDDVIAGYEPEQVIEGYNELAAVSPQASTQIAMMRPMLRKWLTQGGMEPFEVQELTNVEKTLRQNQALGTPQKPATGPTKDVQRTTSILG